MPEWPGTRLVMKIRLHRPSPIAQHAAASLAWVGLFINAGRVARALVQPANAQRSHNKAGCVNCAFAPSGGDCRTVVKLQH